jgi:hypothetical protein
MFSLVLARSRAVEVAKLVLALGLVPVLALALATVSGRGFSRSSQAPPRVLDLGA